MWDNAALLNRLTRWIIIATVLLAGGYVFNAYLVKRPPVQRIEVHGAVQPQTLAMIPKVVARLQGSFFSLDMDEVQHEFELIPWVYRAHIQRIWPGRIVVNLEERIPLAAWNDRDTLSIHGEVYPAKPWPGLPQVYAPDGTEYDVARRYHEFSAVLAAGGWQIARVQRDRRSAWKVVLSNGMTLELGQDQLQERLQRFVTFFPAAAQQASVIQVVDLRYPNGFAVRGAVQG